MSRFAGQLISPYTFMWFGNFQHTVYQLASFHVQLRLGKEEARQKQMRVKVWCFRSLCPERLWWDFSSKTVPLNPPESGFGNFGCRARGNGKQDCCKGRFHMKCPITCCSWRQVSPVGVKQRSKPLPPMTCFIFRSHPCPQ